MAILNEEEEEFKNKESPVTGGTSYIGSGSATAAAPNAPRQQSSQGGFSNIVNYLTAKNSGDEMANKVVGGLDMSAGDAQYDADKFGVGLKQDVAAGTPKFNTSTAASWMAETAPNQAAKDEAAKTGQAPTVSFTKTAPDSTYKGPAGFSEDPRYVKAQQSTQNAQDQVSSMGTFSGLQNALGSTYGYGAKAKPGVAKLDAALTKFGSGAKPLQQGIDKWSGIGDYLGGWAQKGQQAIDAAKNQAKTVSDQWATAQTNAQNNAAATNKIYGDIAGIKRGEDQKAAEWKAGEAAREAERQRQGKENEAWGKQYLDNIDKAKENDIMEQRKAQIAQWKRKGTGDGYIWLESDYDHYLKTGEGPHEKQFRQAADEKGRGYI